MFFLKTFLTLLITNTLYATHTNAPLNTHEIPAKSALYCSEPNGVTLYTSSTLPEQGIKVSCFETEKDARHFYTTMLHTKETMNTVAIWIVSFFTLALFFGLIYDLFYFLKHGEKKTEVYTLKKQTLHKPSKH